MGSVLRGDGMSVQQEWKKPGGGPMGRLIRGRDRCWYLVSGALVKQNNEKLGHAAQKWIRAEGHAQVACAWLAPPWVCRYAPAAERVMV